MFNIGLQCSLNIVSILKQVEIMQKYIDFLLKPNIDKLQTSILV